MEESSDIWGLADREQGKSTSSVPIFNRDEISSKYTIGHLLGTV